jgi:hypothetical protein
LAIKIKPAIALTDLQENRTRSPHLRDRPLGSSLSPFNKMTDSSKTYMQYGTLPAQESQTNVDKYQTLSGRIEMQRQEREEQQQ